MFNTFFRPTWDNVHLNKFETKGKRCIEPIKSDSSDWIRQVTRLIMLNHKTYDRLCELFASLKHTDYVNSLYLCILLVFTFSWFCPSPHHSVSKFVVSGHLLSLALSLSFACLFFRVIFSLIRFISFFYLFSKLHFRKQQISLTNCTTTT